MGRSMEDGELVKEEKAIAGTEVIRCGSFRSSLNRVGGCQSILSLIQLFIQYVTRN